ncbi:divergent polysaccharide deacetylase family protein [Ruegeria atlantica]|uniref:divergent polysaccharide deacetylase family protein n=1 Tax=Ruegeria atlantica TaxID=81569 RepID=UPI001479D9F3|nr:divergent polysaccharide deacetylase family protein [Ruegeria atlantica]
MGGFVSGMIVATVVVLVLGAVLSLNAPLTKKPDVVTAAPEPEVVQVPNLASESTKAIGDSDVLDLPPAAPDSSSTQADTLAELSDVEVEPDAQPLVPDTSVNFDTPDAASSSSVNVRTEAPVAPQSPPLLQVSPNTESLPDVSVEVPAVQTQPENAETEPKSEPETSEVVAQEPEQNPFEDSPIAVEGDEDTAPRKLPRIASVPRIGGGGEGSTSPTIGQRVVPLTDRDAGEATVDAAVPGKPIETYAADFENPDSKPLMSIILIDDEGAYGAEALGEFPYPLTFAVSPEDPEAAEKMARHREAGFEVLALADLPKSASARDAEVSLAVWLDTLPETVGILEGVETGIQGNRKLADQVAEIAGGTGRGLITQDNGLNTVQKLAARNGVPSGVIFRDIDGARQDPKVMRRFLDQAAFRAGQEGSVVMLGRLRPDTISALLLWGLEDRGNRVAMAPISAVMIKEVQ